MRMIRAVMATTRVDLHGERFALAALESMRDHIRSAYLPFIADHDPRCPPVGRVIDADIVRLDDGEHALEASVELFEDGPLPQLDERRSISVGTPPSTSLQLTIDRTFSLPDFEQPVAAIAKLFGDSPRFEVKKALDPIAVLAIGVGAFAGGKFAGAFFSKLGTDAAAALSARLKEVFAHKRPDQTRLLKFEFYFDHNGETRRADVIMTAPHGADIDQFLSDGLRALDQLLPEYIDQIDGLIRYVFMYSNGRFTYAFGVRRDARPFFPENREKS